MENEKEMSRAALVEMFNQLLADFYVVKIQIVPATGLEVPGHIFDRKDFAVLEYGYDMPTPIDGLEITEEGIRAVLSFSRTPTPTFVPWEAVREIYADAERPKQDATGTSRAAKKGTLRLV